MGRRARLAVSQTEVLWRALDSWREVAHTEESRQHQQASLALPKLCCLSFPQCFRPHARIPRVASSYGKRAPGRQQQNWCSGCTAGTSLPLAGGADVSQRYKALETADGAWSWVRYCGNKNDYRDSVSGFRLGIYHFQLPGTGFRSGGISFPVTGYRLRVVQELKFLVPVPLLPLFKIDYFHELPSPGW